MQTKKPTPFWEIILLLPFLGLIATVTFVRANHINMVIPHVYIMIASTCMRLFMLAIIVRIAQRNKANRSGVVPVNALGLPTGAPAGSGQPGPETIMALVYASKPADRVRCMAYSLTHSPVTGVVALLFAVVVAVPFTLMLHHGSFGPVDIIRFAGIIIGTYLFFCGISCLTVLASPSTNGEFREATVGLSPTGFSDIMSKMSQFIPWSRVRDIRRVGPDVFIFHASGGNYFPNLAANNPENAELFLQCAKALWKGLPLPPGPYPMNFVAGPAQPWAQPSPAPDPGVWPPPPAQQSQPWFTNSDSQERKRP